MLTKYWSNLPAGHKLMHEFTQQQVEKEQPFILNNLSCVRMLKVTYPLSTSECISTHRSKQWKEKSIILNHTSCVRILTKYWSNLQAEHKWMQEYTCRAASGERAVNRTACVKMLTKYESNLPTEYKWMREFKKQQVDKSNHTFLITHLVLKR